MTSPADLLDYAPISRSPFGPALNERGYYVGRVERNLYWVTDDVYQSAFLTTNDGVVLFDARPSIGGNLRRAVDEIAAANGVSNRVTHLVYLDAVTECAAAPIIAKYTDVLTDAGIEASITTMFQTIQSYRLDRGHSGPIHP